MTAEHNNGTGDHGLGKRPWHQVEHTVYVCIRNKKKKVIDIRGVVTFPSSRQCCCGVGVTCLSIQL